MGLRILFEGGVFAPIVICNRCQQRIETAAEGNYIWGGEDSLLMFEHKRCHRADRMLSGVLAHLPVYLGNSLRIDWEKARTDIELLDRIG